jgi:hypothetical protein
LSFRQNCKDDGSGLYIKCEEQEYKTNKLKGRNYIKTIGYLSIALSQGALSHRPGKSQIKKLPSIIIILVDDMAKSRSKLKGSFSISFLRVEQVQKNPKMKKVASFTLAGAFGAFLSRLLTAANFLLTREGRGASEFTGPMAWLGAILAILPFDGPGHSFVYLALREIAS